MRLSFANILTSRFVCRKADTLLSMKHGMVRLDNVWGVGGGVRPVKYLVKKIVLLLKEYLCSGDIQEATLCLKELEVPHFHHELVYEVRLNILPFTVIISQMFLSFVGQTRPFLDYDLLEIFNIALLFMSFQAVIMVIESMHEKTEEAMAKLLQSLFRSFVITIEQMRNVSISLEISKASIF